MKILIERYIEQVKDGSHYKGHAIIADRRFEYEVRFCVSIPNLDKLTPSVDKQEIRRRFQITLQRGVDVIELADDEYGFFCMLLAQPAIEFYHNAQTRDTNENILLGGNPFSFSALFRVRSASFRGEVVRRPHRRPPRRPSLS